MIELKDVTRSYGSFQALHSISFKIDHASGVTALLGNNGAGKSTTMKILSGSLNADSGSVAVMGFNPSDSEESLLLKRSLGYLPETAPLYLEMSVGEYLTFCGKIRNLTSSDLKLHIQEMIERLSLESCLNTPIRFLSKGFRHRTALAGALIHHPSIIILDEPTASLDPHINVEVINYLKELGKRTTLLLSTHILKEAEEICSRVIILNKGRIVFDRSMKEIQSKNVYAVHTDAVKGEGFLRSIPFVHDVCPLEDKESLDENYRLFRVTLTQDVPEKLFATFASSSLNVKEIYRVSTSLDDIFRQHTTEESSE